MTTERGPVVPVELLVGMAAYKAVYDGALHGQDDETLRAIGRDVFAEIHAAGFEIVETGRLGRTRRVAVNAGAYCFGLGTYGDLEAALRALQSGDLDGVPEVGA